VSKNAFLPVLLLSVGYFALRLPWLFSVPMMDAPDEVNHVWVTQFLSDHLRAPSASDVFAAGSVAQYGPLPPFGYLPNALIGHLTPETYFRLGARIGTLLAGFPTVIAAYVLGKEIFVDRFLALALPLLVVLHPQLIFTHSYTNTDGLVTSLCSIAIVIAVQCAKNGTTYRKATLLGFLMGWAALAKANSLSLLPAFLFIMWRACQAQGTPLIEIVKVIGTFGGTLAMTCGWWYARNYFEYAGDCLGSRTMIKIWEPSLPVVDGKVVKPWPPIASVSYWRFIFFDFWGLFGFMNRYLWRPLYLVYFALFITSIVGWVNTAAKAVKRPDNGAATAAGETAAGAAAGAAGEGEGGAATGSHSHQANQSIWQFFAACAALNLVAVLYVTVTGVSGPHGRYLFPSELPILSMILAGFSTFGARAQRILCFALMVLCLVSTVSGWLTYYCGHSWIQ
jgi:Dolichyl-phosphate-mannose-protein mannosyltransferase